ncbi:MAG TPA: glutamate 5-kinase [Solirubrobacteraceae bacterium]|nr:glutamate 5-kinase [Solirubrobacteraceae bacterium]
MSTRIGGAVVVKVGSSVLADERGEPREAVLEQICAALARARKRGQAPALVSSGAIARGVSALGLAGRPAAIAELQAASAVGQGRLFSAYDRLLAAQGLLGAQVLLTAADLHERTRYLNARRTLATLLQWGVVPVINENDTTATDEISFGDNDFLAAQVATALHAQLLVLLTDVEGIYSSDPRLDGDARLIGEIGDPELLAEMLEHSVSAGTSQWGTGGMRAKLAAAQIATAAGVATIICSGLAEGALDAALAGGPSGTRIAGRPREDSAFKLWLRFAKPARGTLIVDEGASAALRSNGSSLLPVGIIAVEGEFQAGDAVEVRERSGELIAKGLVSYSAAELQRIKGCDSRALRKLITDATDEEAIHRDQLVLAGA